MKRTGFAVFGGYMDNSITSGKTIVELESLRGIAALLVVAFHIPKWNPLLDLGIINNAYLMVELFFVLSGFVIFTAYQNRITTFAQLVKFQFLRFGRLYPVHLLFLLVFLGFEFAKYVVAQKFGINSPNSTPFGNNDLAAFIKNIFLIQAILPYQTLTFNNPAWSISTEFYTYLLFAILVLTTGRFKVIAFGVIAVAAIGLLGLDQTYGMTATLRCLAGFFLGCLTAYFVDRYTFTVPRLTLAFMAIALIAFLHFKEVKTWDTVVFALTIGLVLGIVNSPDTFAKKVLRIPLFVWFGKISYSVYMAHLAVIWVVIQFIRVVVKKPEFIGPNGKSLSQLSALETCLTLGVIFGGVLLLSYLVYRFVEAPMRLKSRAYVRADERVTEQA